MRPELLRRELEAAGLVVLDVSPHPHDATVARIYLHGAQGQWVNGYALGIVAEVPGVRSVVASALTPTIILAWLDGS